MSCHVRARGDKKLQRRSQLYVSSHVAENWSFSALFPRETTFANLLTAIGCDACHIIVLQFSSTDGTGHRGVAASSLTYVERGCFVRRTRRTSRHESSWRKLFATWCLRSQQST